MSYFSLEPMTSKEPISPPVAAAPSQRSFVRRLSGAETAIGAISSAAGVAAILLYGSLYVAYDTFYRRLGLTTQEAGIGWQTVLNQSAGLIVSATVLGMFTFGVMSWLRLSRSAVVAALTASVFLIWALVQLPFFAVEASNDVKAGHPILPLFDKLTHLTLLPIRASPVLVEPKDKADPNTSLANLRQENLLFLAQANGQAVLYDHIKQQAVFVSLDAVVLHVGNCQPRKNPNLLCNEVSGRSGNRPR